MSVVLDANFIVAAITPNPSFGAILKKLTRLLPNEIASARLRSFPRA